jgi:ceramide glucosyltransferase
LLGLWPGIALVRRFGQVNFTLGACTLFRREALLSIGGWDAFGSCLAEDQRLGEALVKARQQVRLSRLVATLDSDALSWRDYWLHQRRVSVTYRVANPKGFAGVLFTFGPAWSILWLVIFWEPWLLLAALAALAFRLGRVSRSVRLLGFEAVGWSAVISVASAVEALCWLLSWFSREVWWSGRWWRVSANGEISPPA